jgi:ATP-dependent DNA helicase PIF1
VLLREIIKYFLLIPRVVAITAPTGIAGLNIGGSTIHSFAGIGLGKEPREKLAEKIKHSKTLFHRWTSTNVLIIDEGQ